MHTDSVLYVSILNWNNYQTTLHCLDSFVAENFPANLRIKIFVVDNGSATEDWQKLSESVHSDSFNKDHISLIRLEKNSGYSAGHNITINQAIQDDATYVWLVNNDGALLPDTISKLMEFADNNPKCGAISPLIIRNDGSGIVDFYAAYNDWHKYDVSRANSIAEWHEIEAAHEGNIWVSGAATCYRVAAMKEVGLFDESYFAYYEDNDICARLSAAGWLCKLATEARFLHDIPKTRPAYFYYLLARNAFLFYCRHTPAPFKNPILIRLRLTERALFKANVLRYKFNDQAKSDACLLGCYDGLLGRGGKPDLNRKPPLILELLRKLLYTSHIKHLNNQH
jgi:GT2 family glycosyltransferase